MDTIISYSYIIVTWIHLYTCFDCSCLHVVWITVTWFTVTWIFLYFYDM